ncbi:MAG: pyridoxine 5'-phosphate synthase [Thermodesulfobacteriota bacterium]
MPELIVNVDHIATLREARKAREPDPVHAAALAELGGAGGIIVHLREDRRHIKDRDVNLLRDTVQTELHLEMAATKEMHAIAQELKPEMVCLVPEKRQELTTEGGMDLLGRELEINDFLKPFQEQNIKTSLFIDASPEQIEAAYNCATEYIEIHTGHYADAGDHVSKRRELQKIQNGITQARELELEVNLGHGLNYKNILSFSRVSGIREYSIGHSIVARAALVGMERAVRDMSEIIRSFPVQD